jgi:hypothetical protein
MASTNLHSLCVFGPGGSSVSQLRDLLNEPEYSGDDTAITVLRDGDNFYLRVSNVEGNHPTDLNESTQCPGGLRC